MVFQDHGVRLDSQELQVLLVFPEVRASKATRDNPGVQVLQDNRDFPDPSVSQVHTSVV